MKAASSPAERREAAAPSRYRRILVPLDGSMIAESALTEALFLARLTGAGVTLLEVVPPLDQLIERGAHPIFVDEQVEARKGRALRYLKSVAGQKEWRGIAVNTAVETGAVAEAVLAHARHHDVDLIIMATHGISGFKRWLLGSVAQKIVHGADRPVLLVRPKPGPPI